MSKSIEKIEGIGPKTGEALRNAGVRTVESLLKAGADKKSRAALAEKTGISEARILKCINMADLFRINGVASQYAELLECAGVDTVKELKNRNAENLAAKMEEVNKAKNLVRRPPSTSIVSDWVAQAKKLPGIISY
jgi:predicted flap endonuclease-1-like 5' DNA nuclease